jgi:hypothetical protein
MPSAKKVPRSCSAFAWPAMAPRAKPRSSAETLFGSGNCAVQSPAGVAGALGSTGDAAVAIGWGAKTTGAARGPAAAEAGICGTSTIAVRGVASARRVPSTSMPKPLPTVKMSSAVTARRDPVLRALFSSQSSRASMLAWDFT